jgi:hypothetical protein
VSELISPPSQDIIEISPPGNIFVVEFAFERHPGVSVILPATGELMARLEAWRLFPEHKRNASATSVYQIQFAEYDWQNDRFIVVKLRKRPKIPPFILDEFRPKPKPRRSKKRGNEEAQ